MPLFPLAREIEIPYTGNYFYIGLGLKWGSCCIRFVFPYIDPPGSKVHHLLLCQHMLPWKRDQHAPCSNWNKDYILVPLQIGPRPLVPQPWTIGPTADWSQTIGPTTLDYWPHCRLVPDHWSHNPGLLVPLQIGPRPLVPQPWTIGPTAGWSQTIGPTTLDYWSHCRLVPDHW